MSATVKGELNQLTPSLRRKLPAVPASANPVPPFAVPITPVIFEAEILRFAAVKVPRTLRLPGIRTASTGRPRTRVLLEDTIEPAPIAEAKLRLPETTLASAPIIVFELPSVLLIPASMPTKTFSSPSVFPRPDPRPKNELLAPPVLKKPESIP